MGEIQAPGHNEETGHLCLQRVSRTSADQWRIMSCTVELAKLEQSIPERFQIPKSISEMC